MPASDTRKYAGTPWPRDCTSPKVARGLLHKQTPTYLLCPCLRREVRHGFRGGVDAGSAIAPAHRRRGRVGRHRRRRCGTLFTRPSLSNEFDKRCGHISLPGLTPDPSQLPPPGDGHDPPHAADGVRLMVLVVFVVLRMACTAAMTTALRAMKLHCRLSMPGAHTAPGDKSGHSHSAMRNI